MDEKRTYPWTPVLRDISMVLSALVAAFVVIRSIGNIYIWKRISEEQTEAIKSLKQNADELQRWRYEHEISSARRATELGVIDRRIDRCCPLYQNRIYK